MESILVATDFSAEAGSATARAASIAKETGWRGALVHVLPGTLPVDLHLRAASQAQQALAVVADDLMQKGLNFEPRLLEGDVATELAQAANDFDMVAAGARGEDILMDFELGRTSVRLVRRSRRPTLIVKRPADAPYRRVLVAVDFSEPSRFAAECAAQIAPGASFDFVHAYEVEFESTLRLADADQTRIEAHRSEARQKAILAMGDFSEKIALPRERILPAVTRGYPAKVILDHAKSTGAQLIVIGKHAAGVIEQVVVGSVAVQVLGMADCDVLVVPQAAA